MIEYNTNCEKCHSTNFTAMSEDDEGHCEDCGHNVSYDKEIKRLKNDYGNSSL